MFKGKLCESPMLLGLMLWAVATVYAQGTSFTYQGKVTDGGNLANGQYDLQFKLFDTQAVGTGTQQAGTVTVTNVTVTAGIFTVQLDFGVCPACFDGSARFLEIAVKQTSGSTFTTLSPRQPVTSNPYAVRSLSAAAADGLSIACVNCVTSIQIQSIQGSQVTGIVSGSQISGAIPVASVPAGSVSYIQNQNASPQTSSNFNISGVGTADIFNAATQFSLGGNRILSAAGTENLFVGLNAGDANSGTFNTFFGVLAGQSNTTAVGNSFFGTKAGQFNTTGQNNTFVGSFAGLANTSGANNSFFGSGAGNSNTTGNQNAFFGYETGVSNTTEINNSFFGFQSGSANATGTNNNSFFGSFAGTANTTGFQNSFVGEGAGSANTTGSNNSSLGFHAGITNLTGGNLTIVGSNANVGVDGLNFATAIGAGAVVSGSNTIALGRSNGSDTVLVPGNLTLSGTLNASIAASSITGIIPIAHGGTGLTTSGAIGSFLRSNGTSWVSSAIQASDIPSGSANYIQNTTSPQTSSNFNISGNGTAGGTLTGDIVSATTQYNIGGNRVLSTLGSNNLFAGVNTGTANTTGSQNSFFGKDAGAANQDGGNNNFFGFHAGLVHTTNGNNSFFGSFAGAADTSGTNNSFFGEGAGSANTTGASNVFLGFHAGNANTTGSNNTAIGAGADVASSSLSFATAIGAGAIADFDNLIVLGRASGADLVDVHGVLRVSGSIRLGGLGTSGGSPLCWNAISEISLCSSSARYKANIKPFLSGINLIERLRPVTFNWKEGGRPDLGLIAEEVATVEPLFTFTNNKGEIEGVKYSQLTVVLINAIKEQQEQINVQTRQAATQQNEIKQQQTVIDGLKRIVCSDHPNADLCK